LLHGGKEGTKDTEVFEALCFLGWGLPLRSLEVEGLVGGGGELRDLRSFEEVGVDTFKGVVFFVTRREGELGGHGGF